VRRRVVQCVTMLLLIAFTDPTAPVPMARHGSTRELHKGHGCAAAVAAANSKATVSRNTKPETFLFVLLCEQVLELLEVEV